MRLRSLSICFLTSFLIILNLSDSSRAILVFSQAEILIA